MNELPLPVLFGLLGLTLLLSGLFSSSETALMTINRYRLRHLAAGGHRGAQLAEKLLERPDRIIGLILLGNNFVNILASMITTVIALRLFGEGSLALAAGLLTLIVLIFSEVAPKTFAALNAERLALPAAYIYYPLLKLIYPLVWLVNLLANGVLKLLGLAREDGGSQALTAEELRTVVLEAGAMIPQRHQRMLLGIIDLERATVEDIMVPRNEIIGIDLADPWEEIREQLMHSRHTRLPLYEESIDQIRGIVHMRRVLNRLIRNDLDAQSLRSLAREGYFIPEGTPLNTQLLNFQREKRRIGLVVDEYGDIQGLVTLEDILEEIVGEFTTDPAASLASVAPEPDGSYIVNATSNIRTLNRRMGWDLPTRGPKTLNGLILEHLETIPDPGTSVKFGDYQIEIIKSGKHGVRSARVLPPMRSGVIRRRRS